MEFDNSLIDEFVAESSEHLQHIEEHLLNLEKTMDTPDPALVDAASATVRVLLDAKPEIALRIGHEDPALEIFADNDRIIQVITNLLDNAIKFTDRGGIDVATREVRDGVLELRVTDTGTGMTEKERALVFQKYYQAESRSKGISKAPKGTGLGLAICKEIVEHYGGSIGVEAGPGGEGSSFFVRLPLLGE